MSSPVVAVPTGPSETILKTSPGPNQLFNSTTATPINNWTLDLKANSSYLIQAKILVLPLATETATRSYLTSFNASTPVSSINLVAMQYSIANGSSAQTPSFLNSSRVSAITDTILAAISAQNYWSVTYIDGGVVTSDATSISVSLALSVSAQSITFHTRNSWLTATIER